MTTVLFLSALLLCQPLSAFAANEYIAREEPPASDDTREISMMESDYVSLFKEIKKSPQDEGLKKKAEEEKKKLSELSLHVGKKLERKGYLLAAVGSFQRALLYDPGSTSAREALLRAKENLDRLDQKESDQVYQEGMQLYLNGDQKAAADDWKRALELNSQNEDAQNALEKINPPRPRKPAARKSSEDNDSSDGDSSGDSETQESLWDQDFRQGLDHETAGEYDQAAESFKKALQYRPGDPSTRKELAKVEAVLGKTNEHDSQDFYLLAVHSLQRLDYRSAYQNLNDSISADPSNEVARNLLEKLVKQRPELLRVKASSGDGS